MGQALTIGIKDDGSVEIVHDLSVPPGEQHQHLRAIKFGEKKMPAGFKSLECWRRPVRQQMRRCLAPDPTPTPEAAAKAAAKAAAATPEDAPKTKRKKAEPAPA